MPQQATVGGVPFTLDLGDYVTDRESAATSLTYAVTSGGGTFSGEDYTNTFDTMGEYDVNFTVTDGAKTSTGTFRVKVTTANFAVVREDSTGVMLLDTATNKFVRVAGAVATPSFAAGLSDGRVVYQIASGAGQQLWVFDPLTRRNTRLAENASGDVTYRAKTSDDKIVYTTGTGNNLRLYYYNPVTDVARDLAQGVLSSITVGVNSNDVIFYEVGDAGQGDIYGYDPADDDIFAVSTEPTDEQLQVVLPDGGVVFTRVGGGGEDDLFYYKIGTGLVEIGSDITSIATWNKVFAANGTNSKVVFAAQNGPVSDLYFWNPGNGQTTSISAAFTAGAYDAYIGIGDQNQVVFNRVNSGSDIDALFYDLDDGVNATLRNGGDVSQVLGVTDDGTNAWALVRASGATSDMLAISLVGTPATQTWSAGGAVVANVDAIANGDVVAVRDDGTALNFFDVSAGTWGTQINGADLAFGGDGLESGDFVFSLTVSAQTDLAMWDESAGAAIVVSNVAGTDAFQLLTANNSVLFTRIVGTNTNADLFVWDGTTETRLTDIDAANLRHDHTVLGKYAGSR